MMYGFQLLSLLLMFLLVMIYYTKKDNFIKGNKIFKCIILVTYIMQLISPALYIAYENGSGILFSKIYLILINLWFGLIAFYYISFLLKGKYKENSNKYKVILRDIGAIFSVVQLISGIGTLMGPSGINSYGTIDYYGHFVILFICFYLILELLVLLIGIKKIEKKCYIHLIVIWLIELVMFFLQARGHEIPIYEVGIIFCVFYSYFMLENNDSKLLKDLTLERDYAKSQSIDKHDFLRVLSHEIRTPLNAIDGFSQIIADSDNLDEIKKDVKDIRLASRDLIDVINGMIDLSILESGNLVVLEENYNIYDMLDDIKNIAESKMREKNVEFIVDIDNDIPEVLSGDSERISQVILNLLTNAIKFTDKGNITLKVDSIKSNTKCRLKIMVSDTGKGIKKEDLSNIFEGKTTNNGATLGLSVSKYLLELMGGFIEVESTYGTGSKFIITLDQKIINDTKEGKVSRKRILKPFDASGKRILLVDDNKMNLKVGTKSLEPYKIEVVEANSGRECLDILEKDKDFDLILMDDLMPEMSGTECLDILKKIERVDGFYIPIVVLTANAITGMKEKYLNLGFDDYLAKPMDKYELDRILKKYLKDKKNK